MKDANNYIHKFCNHLGIIHEYQDHHGKSRHINFDTICSIANALEISIENEANIFNYLAAHEKNLQEQLLNEVCVCWQTKPFYISLRISKNSYYKNINVQIQLENGETLQLCIEFSKLKYRKKSDPLLTTESLYSYFDLLLPPLPIGYHHVQVEIDNKTAVTLLIVAPLNSGITHHKKSFGFFAPIYSLHSSNSIFGGNLSDFNEFLNWSVKKGATMVGTLPFYAAFCDEINPDPYSPMTRLFWNEMYLDIVQLPEHRNVLQTANREIFSTNSHRCCEQLRSQLIIMANRCRTSERASEFAAYVARHPELQQYARFQAIHFQQQKPWYDWRNTYFSAEDYDYHLYAQWAFETQLYEIKKNAKRKNLLIYSDLPMHVRADGFDAYQYKEQFVRKICLGKPFNCHLKNRQKYFLAPLNPLTLSKHHFSYFIKSLRTIMPYIGLLGIKKISELERMFWIPEGASAEYGAYVKYPREILHAILLLEAHRHQVTLIKEDLSDLRAIKEAYLQNIHQEYIFPYAVDDPESFTEKTVPRRSVARLNTQDMPSFAAYLQGIDFEKRIKHRLLTKHEAATEKKKRKQILQRFIDFSKQYEKTFGYINTEEFSIEKRDLFILFLTATSLLAKSNAEFLLINLDDLWLATRQQNWQLTTKEYLQHSFAYSIEQLDTIPNLSIVLALLNQLRETNPLNS